ncbi:uncharacterized protein LOC120328477 [Styela clava]
MSDWNLLSLGNAPLSFEAARNVLLNPANAVKIFPDVPCINPVGGRAYLFQSRLALCKLHAKLDPYKFMYLGKGYNKEFGVMKRYYHLKHNRTDLNKQLYNFQRHIYCLAIGECSSDTMILYLVHYFGNDYLLEHAPYRKGVSSNNVVDHTATPLDISCEETVIESLASTVSDNDCSISFSEVKSESEEKFPTSEDFTPVADDDQSSSPTSISRSHMSVQRIESNCLTMDHGSIEDSSCRIASSSQNSLPIFSAEQSSSRKRKSNTVSSENQRKIFKPDKRLTLNDTDLNNAEYLFAVHTAAQLQQLPRDIKAKVKFQIATIFYEAEMKALNCSEND